MCLRHQPAPQSVIEAAAAIGRVPSMIIMTPSRMYIRIVCRMPASSSRKARISSRKDWMSLLSPQAPMLSSALCTESLNR